MAEDQSDPWHGLASPIQAPTADPWAGLASPISQPPQQTQPQKTSTTSDVEKTLAGNVAPNTVANLAANAMSAPYTMGSYAAQMGVKGGEYLGEGLDELRRAATGEPPATQADYNQQSKDLMNAIRSEIGLKPTDNGDISQLVPTPSNLVSGAANAIGTPLYEPKTEVGKNVSTIGNIATAGIGSGAKVIPSLIGATTSDLAQQGVKNVGGGEGLQFAAGLAGGLGGAKVADILPINGDVSPINPRSTTDTVQPHDAIKAASDLSSTIFDNISRANKYYSLPDEIANGQSVSAPQVKDYLNGVIYDIQADPFHEARTLVPKLQKTLDSLPDDGTVPVADLLDLRRASNANFKPGRMSDKDSVYAGLNKAVNSGLDEAKDNIPHFSDALDVADNYWKNSVAQPITKNPVLQKVFDMEDAHNMRQFNNGQVDDIPDVTKQAANNMVSKIKDVDTYNAVRRLLPEDSGKSLDSAILQNIAPDRLKAAGQTLYNTVTGHFPSALRSFADVINPSATPQQKALIRAIKAQDSYVPIGVRNEAAEGAYNTTAFNVNKNATQPIAATQLAKGKPTEAFYNPQDASQDIGSASSNPNVYGIERGYSHGGTIPHKTWAKLVREHGKIAKVKMSQLNNESARKRLLDTAARLTQKQT